MGHVSGAWSCSLASTWSKKPSPPWSRNCHHNPAKQQLDSSFLIIYLLLTVLGLRCCVGFSLAVASGVCSLVAGLGLLLAVAALIMEHQLWGVQASVLAASGLKSRGSQTLGHSRNSVAHGLGCSAARGIFLDQEVNRVSWHRQADSLPLSHQESPWTLFLQSTGSMV